MRLQGKVAFISGGARGMGEDDHLRFGLATAENHLYPRPERRPVPTDTALMSETGAPMLGYARISRPAPRQHHVKIRRYRAGGPWLPRSCVAE